MQVEADPPRVIAEWHNNAADFASATVVTIAGGNQMVDAVLTGLVTGTVTSELGQAIEGICVEAYDSTSERTIIGSDLTVDTGAYTIDSIGKDYKLYFYDP